MRLLNDWVIADKKLVVSCLHTYTTAVFGASIRHGKSSAKVTRILLWS